MRPIDADVLLSVARNMQSETEETAYNFLNNAMNPSTEWECVEGLIENAPTIEPEVRHGRWIEESEPDENGYVIAMCNQCYHTDERGVNIKVPYCWYCGAKMDGGADNGIDEN